MVAILSAHFGGYHQEPRPLPKQTLHGDAVLITDKVVMLEGWRAIVTDLGVPPRMASKIVKCTPSRYVVDDIVIWIDAQLRVCSSLFSEFCVQHLGDKDIAVLRHPWRSRLLQEGRAGKNDPRFVGQDPLGQAKHYLALGHPNDWGLYWTMIVVRRMTAAVIEFGERWLKEQKQWSTHDQVSFPHVCRTVLGQPAELPFPEGLAWLEGFPPRPAGK